MDRLTSETFYIPNDDVKRNETNVSNNATTILDVPDRKIDSNLLEMGTNIDGYIILDLISEKGKESDVYLAGKGGSKYALKIYQRNFEIRKPEMELLRSVDCPYIVKLHDYGTYNNYPYEVYDYYENGTLQEYGKVDEKKIKQYINQLNEAINTLHNLSETITIIHGDIKPSNIFISNDKESVLLGDFGISSVVDSDDYSIGSICGTPEYAPPSYGVVDKVKKTKAYDYGSLGLVIFYMATGYSYFANLSTEQIAESWSKGIIIPDYIETRIKLLLKGLLEIDENKRFGYKKVRDWFEGSFVHTVKPREVFSKGNNKSEITLWFGIFDNQIVEVSTIQELVNQMKLHWQQAVYKIRDDNFYHFVEKLDKSGELVSQIKQIVEENDDDAAVFKIIYTLSSDSNIVYKGVNYGSPVSYIKTIINNSDGAVKEVLLKGLFRFYISKMGYPENIMKIIDEAVENNIFPESVKVGILNYVFSSDKTYKGISNLDELREKVSNMTLAEIDLLLEDDMFVSWIYANGMKEIATNIILNKGKN